MPSFLKFYLDLEANGEIIVPNYTTISATTHIKIVSDIEIAQIYDLKIVDSLGMVYPYVPYYPNSDEFELEIFLRDFPLGKTTVHASILDVVGNRAVLTPKTFNIIKSNLLYIKLSDSAEFEVVSLDSEPFKISLSDKGDM